MEPDRKQNVDDLKQLLNLLSKLEKNGASVKVRKEVVKDERPEARKTYEQHLTDSGISKAHPFYWLLEVVGAYVNLCQVIVKLQTEALAMFGALLMSARRGFELAFGLGALVALYFILKEVF